MHHIHVRNVNHALAEGLLHLTTVGRAEDSRNGPVLVSPTPVVTTYQAPQERVLLLAARDANPFFHLMEALWMLAGRHDTEFVTRFNKRMDEFSDDGATLWGAYGYRWRQHFGLDQLNALVDELRHNPTSRRCVLSMWDGRHDFTVGVQGGKDVPCNTHAYVEVREGVLNLTVLCRSNDAVWGAHGANAVHFSLLQEYLAARVGAGLGVLRQFSNNYHTYTELRGYPNALNPALRQVDLRYDRNEVQPFQLVHVPERWDADLRRFLTDPLGDALYDNPFFHGVVAPMYASWNDRKAGFDGMAAALAIEASDWRCACVEWIARREKALRGTVAA